MVDKPDKGHLIDDKHVAIEVKHVREISSFDPFSIEV